MPRNLVATLALLLAVPTLAFAQSGACVVDNDCSDRVYCNGAERCQPGSPNADARGCIAALSLTPCMAGQTCNEIRQVCETPIVDRDGDGLRSWDTGGNDCDDQDRNRFPGNQEVWDEADHDEDCDGTTHGFTPGFGAQARTGTFQACSGEGLVIARGTIGGSATFSRSTCADGSACVTQPTGDGFCLARPPGYAAGPELPAPEDQLEAERRRRQAGAEGRAMAPLQIAPPKARPSVLPPPVSAPSLAAPSCDAPRMRDKSGACVLPKGTCPDGMAYSEKTQACEKK